MDEIDQLQADLEEKDAYIKGRETDIAALGSLISGYRDGFNQYKLQRDKLHDERKYDSFTCLLEFDEHKHQVRII